MNAQALLPLLKDTYTAWNEDRAPRLGAALSYYTIFSLAPLLIVAIGVAGIFFGEEAARGQVAAQIEEAIGEDAAGMVQTMIQNASKGGQGRSIWATIIGGATILLGAGGLFAQLQDSLNTIWGVQPKPGQGIVLMLRQRFLSFSMVLGVGFVLMVSLALSAAVSGFATWINANIGGGNVANLLQILNFVIGFLIIWLLFAAMYKVLPDVEIQWHDVWIGAAVTAFLFSVGKLALGWYLGRSATSAFGSAGSLVLILLWVYYAAQILFFGAEFTKVYANKFGSHIKPAENAEAVTEDMRATQGMRPQTVGGAGDEPKTGAVEIVPHVAKTHDKPVSAKNRQDFEHTLSVVGGALLALIWFWRRSKKDED